MRGERLGSIARDPPRAAWLWCYDTPMHIIDLLLPEFDREMALTRRALERVPDDRLDFAPHPRSMTLRQLAGHLAWLPYWVVEAMQRTEFDWRRGDPVPEPPAARDALLAQFDDRVKAARGRLAGSSDAELLVPWTFKVDGTVQFTMPRVTVLRTFVLNHTVHHRGQLTVYLRLLDVPVPSLYGPSGDEAA